MDDELAGPDEKWTFDLREVRIIPAPDGDLHELRRALGPVSVPLAALTGISFEPGRRSCRLRLQLRAGADPLTQVSSDWLTGRADPYQLTVEAERSAAAEYFAGRVRDALLVEQVPEGPAEQYLMPGPRVPVTAAAGDGTVVFDGERLRFEWNWLADDRKRAMGPQQLRLADVAAVEWQPVVGLDHGFLRFRPRGMSTPPPIEHDPYSLHWGIKREGGTAVLVAAAVAARLPHPSETTAEPLALPAAAPAPAGEVHEADALLHRLRELGALHRDGILTDDEFAAAKQLLLKPR
ncbi:DUF4429 domain-containing protein [Amycolatopsis albispora]|uniref:Tat pathway signal sequence domain protein n=1 Tax=Amycolatopsis albispora TaxID=1804986 RepID=A0A344LK62_9PSEU|nr:DUF4429 domain-containing protein [Amycolatopsis albispora]AXB48436.1 Tat pathway signal sequence domain protein [Amycolatopsis albispora]